jgi:signal transduction histidine kinase
MGIAVALAGISMAPAPAAAQEPTRLSDEQVERLLDRIEKSADKFRESLDDALDESRVDDSKLKDDLNRYVHAFENATDRLEERFDDDRATGDDVLEVMTRAAEINGAMTRFEFTDRAQGDWRLLRNDLNELARAYNLVWEWKMATLPR